MWIFAFLENDFFIHFIYWLQLPHYIHAVTSLQKCVEIINMLGWDSDSFSEFSLRLFVNRHLKQ